MRTQANASDFDVLWIRIWESTTLCMPSLVNLSVSGHQGDKALQINEDYEYNVRPLSTCRKEEDDRLDATSVSPKAEGLAIEDVLCSLGETKSTFDVRCCDDCDA